MVLVPDDNTPEVLKPSEEAFDFPSAPIRPELASILSFRFLATFPMRRYHLDIAFVKQSLVKFIAVVGLVSYQLIIFFNIPLLVGVERRSRYRAGGVTAQSPLPRRERDRVRG